MMKKLLKKNVLLKLFLCVVIAASAFSCTDDSPVEPQKQSENVIYYFTYFQNPVTHEYETHFCKMDEDGSKRMSITQLPQSNGYYGIQYAANMKRLVLGAYSVMDIDGKNKTYVAHEWSDISYQEISPDSERFFQMYYGRCSLYEAVDNWKRKQIFYESYAYGAKWSHDSKRIIYSNGNIISRNADSADDRKVIYQYDTVNMTGRAGEIFPSPYEGKILFSREGVTGTEFCVMNGDGSDLRVIYSHSGEHRLRISEWSRDGKSVLVYKAESQDLSHIFLLKIDGSGLQQITPEPIRIGSRGLSYSPDASKIVFTQFIPDPATGNSGQSVLKTMNIDGSGEKTLTPKGYNDSAPAWVKR